MWDECITLYVRNCLLCWQHDSINNQYKAKGKNKGFEEELTISPHQNHHHPHNHLAGRDFEEVWPGVRLLLGSTPSARPRCSKCSTLSTLLAVASLSLSLFWSKHHRHKKWAILAMLIRQIHNQCIQSQSVSGNHPVVFLPDSLFYFTPRQSAFLVANDDVGQQVRLKLANSPQFLCSAPSLLNILGNGGRPLAKP